MKAVLGIVAILAWIFIAVPVQAQQDTAMAGRAGEGLTPPGETGQAPPADTGGLTTRQGIEDEAGAAPAGEPAGEEMAGAEAGAEMPRTASAVPLIALAGGILVAAGLYLRRGRRRS